MYIYFELKKFVLVKLLLLLVYKNIKDKNLIFQFDKKIIKKLKISVQCKMINFELIKM